MDLAAQFETLSNLAKSGGELTVWQDIFVKFYQAFLEADRWQQYIQGVGTTLLVTAMALAIGVILGAVVALVRVTHDQQHPRGAKPYLRFTAVHRFPPRGAPASPPQAAQSFPR